ncbi:MAG: matrixin family metalloprotease [Myxococcota bacterium]
MKSLFGSAPWLVAVILSAGCAALQPGNTTKSTTAPRDYWPSRRDYGAFQSAHPELLEPNYLPFMAHRLSGDDPRGDFVVLCRWSASAMPLRLYIDSPVIPESLQDEFDPIEPAQYVEAVEAAIAQWERELEGFVTFERVPDASSADIELVLVAEPAPEEFDRRKLGEISFSDACRVEGKDPDSDRLVVRYQVGSLRVYLADPYGLLNPGQVESIALHEIGHVLGMRSHSPIPADLMYEVMRDRAVPQLSAQDVNSFVSLYQLENGTIFGHVPPGGRDTDPGPLPPKGPPVLSLAPYVDSRLGFDVHLPEGWMRMETAQGMVAIDGVAWDYTASFQVIVHRYATLEGYLARFGTYHLTRGEVIDAGFTEVAGKRAFRAVVLNFEGRSADQITLIEVGDGRVIAVIADCPLEALGEYQDLFEAALASLEIWSGPR